MSWVTAIWSMLIGACLAMALPNLLLGIWQRRAAPLLFVLAVVGVIGMAVAELAFMRAQSAEEFARALAWAQLPPFLVIVALVGFVRCYFGSGRLWLGFAAGAGRFICLVLAFMAPPGLISNEITALRQIPFLGDTVAIPAVAIGSRTHISELSSLLFLIFVIDASITSWRRSHGVRRRKVLVIGGSIVFFALTAAGLIALIDRQILELPYLASFPAVIILVAMVFELGSDLFRAEEVAQKLQTSETSLHEFEERVSLAAEAARLGVWELNTRTHKLWMSDKERELFQFPPGKEMTHEEFQEHVHPDDRVLRDSAIQRAVETKGEYEIEYRALRSDGTVRWIAGRARCVSDGDGTLSRLLGVSMDVTERKETEELFRVATEASPSGTLLVNDQGRIVLVNSHVEELFGYLREELVGKPVEILIPKRFAAEHPARRAEFWAAPTARAMGAGRELFARKKDGTEFPIEIGLNPVQTPRGGLVLATVVDISARKLAEEEARRQRERINLLTRVSLLGNITASLAHELSQPLSAIVSNAYTGAGFIDQGKADPETLREILVDVEADGRRAQDIIENVRNTIKKGTPMRRQISLNEIVINVAHIIQPDAAVHSCEVKTFLANNLPAIEADPTQIEQVLINLVANAFDAMRDVTAGDRKVEILTRHGSDGTVSVSVRDFGIGIRDELRERLFEQFFTTKERGLGMGLAIVHSIIEAHGGKIEAENVKGGGARFHFTLPASEEVPK